MDDLSQSQPMGQQRRPINKYASHAALGLPMPEGISKQVVNDPQVQPRQSPWGQMLGRSPVAMPAQTVGNAGAANNPWTKNPWGGYSLNAEMYRPKWAPKVPEKTTPDPPAPTGPQFTEMAGFQDYDPSMSGTKDTAFGLLKKEAGARGVDINKWDQNFLNSIGAQIGYQPGQNITGTMFNKARRLMFSK